MFRILLVEDNEFNRDMLSRRLSRRGYDVIVAEDGAKGKQAAEEQQVDLVLMDMSLPVMDGWEATRLLKNAEATASIPIIGLSAHAMTGDAEKALEAGCDAYEIKPVDFDRLLKTINHFLLNGDVA